MAAPSAMGPFLRSFTFDHNRQFDTVTSRFLIALVTVRADSAYNDHDVSGAARRTGAGFPSPPG